MRASLVTDAVFSLIPGWYRCKGGKLPLKLAVEESATTFFAVRDLTPEMCKLKEHAEKHANLLRDFVNSFPPPIAVDLIQEFLALKWLDLTNQAIKWAESFGLLSGVERANLRKRHHYKKPHFDAE